MTTAEDFATLRAFSRVLGPATVCIDRIEAELELEREIRFDNADQYAKACAERDQLREALRRIRDESWNEQHCLDLAAAALSGKEPE